MLFMLLNSSDVSDSSQMLSPKLRVNKWALIFHTKAELPQTFFPFVSPSVPDGGWDLQKKATCMAVIYDSGWLF